MPIEINARLLDTMGGDASIARYARICTGRFDPEDGEVIEAEGNRHTVALSDSKTLRRLIRDGHASAFETATCTLFLRCPRAIMDQVQRHRTGAYLQRSLRYTNETDDPTVTPNEVRLRDKYYEKHTGTVRGEIADRFNAALQAAVNAYNDLYDMGMVLEQARFVLPLGIGTESSMTISLRNLLHFLRLRQAPDAQHEIRILADQIAAAVAEWVPLTWAAWTEATDAERGRF